MGTIAYVSIIIASYVLGGFTMYINFQKEKKYLERRVDSLSRILNSKINNQLLNPELKECKPIYPKSKVLGSGVRVSSTCDPRENDKK